MEQNPFQDIPHTPAAHFRLYFFGAVLRLVSLAVKSYEGLEAVVEKFPFLRGYINELSALGLEGLSFENAPRWWRDAVIAWEGNATMRLPMLELSTALALDHEALLLVIASGLAEEDGQFIDVFQALHGNPGQVRASATLLGGMCDIDDRADVRPILRTLMGHGLLVVKNTDEPFPLWIVSVPPLLWEALRGDNTDNPAEWLRHHDAEKSKALEDLILPASLYDKAHQLPAMIDAGEVDGVLVRGPLHNGRRTLLAAIAARAGYGQLEIRGFDQMDDARWRLIGPLAHLLHAIPVIVLELAPGETIRLPQIIGYHGFLSCVLGQQGGIEAEGKRFVTINIPLPDGAARHRHWVDILGVQAPETPHFGQHFRITSGGIRRAATLARSYAALAMRQDVTFADTRDAVRALSREALDALATRETAGGTWSQIVCTRETRQELATLEARCRQRESLSSAVGRAISGSLNPGVRALLKGPSGTGKTLAARVLAATLGMDLYRVDLSAIVNKFIGETEKNLNRIFSRAEELDVILLFDEGDALLGRRTSVSTANDRYANLETNFLLQRIEAHEGVVLITTNAAEHIDGAFSRRMDVIVEFRVPEVSERLAIWRLHLPEIHRIPDGFLNEVAQRCLFTGGQIRNAVLHAAMLANAENALIDIATLESAIQREYRKRGAICPLRATVPRQAIAGA